MTFLLFVVTTWLSAFTANALEWWVNGAAWNFFGLFVVTHLVILIPVVLWRPDALRAGETLISIGKD